MGHVRGAPWSWGAAAGLTLLGVALWSLQRAAAALRTTGAAFEVGDDAFGEGAQTVHLKVLRNTQTGERVEVAWDAGGRTEALALRSPSTGRLREVLLSSRRNASDVRANSGWKGDMLIPYANRIKNGTYSLDGKKYYMARNEDRGAYGKNGLHGYIYSKMLRVASVRADDNAAEVTLEYDFDGQDPGYPFLLSVSLTYRLDASGFKLTTGARNRAPSGGAPLPFYSSWHSYFTVSTIARAIIELDNCSEWNHVLVSNNSNVYSDLIPTGNTELSQSFNGREEIGGSQSEPTYWDDEFKATAVEPACPMIQTRVHDPEAGDASVLWADPQFRWVQVYTGTARNLGEQAIAVEAMSGPADSWNSMDGLRLLQAGESWQGSLGVRLEGSRPPRWRRGPVASV